MTKSKVCSNCKVTTTATLHRNIKQNGAVDFTWVCNRCNKRNPYGDAFYISKEAVGARLAPEEIDALPVLMPPWLENRCVVCGSRDAEKHHWAPRAVFGKDECDQWPKDYLCKNCHDKWHQLVTPQLVFAKGNA